ncbi:MAG: TlpA disulfide reductase family protein [Rikenellaceae bacterium]
MARFLISCMVVLAACSCNNTKVQINGRLIGAEESTLYIERVEGSETMMVDSVVLNDEGRFNVSFNTPTDDPTLYNVVSGAERIPLFLTQGDRVSINSMGSISMGYRVEGSQESELLRLFYQPYLKGISNLDAIASEYASTELSEEERRALARKYSKEYQTIKQTQLKFIIEHQASLAAVYALFQRLPGDQYLFNGDNDVIYLRIVADALEGSYPQSSYFRSLRNTISRMESDIALKNRVSKIDFPDLKLPDIYGKSVELSSLLGKVVLLEFWSSELGNSSTQNSELKELYTKYKDLGFEIYQVGIDNAKSHWITSVQEQRLPWISVSDLKGGASPSLGVYNVSKLPSNFLIDREGTILARDLRGEDLESLINRELAK